MVGIADLIFVDGDPLANISVLGQLAWVSKDGELRRPVECIED